MHKGKEEGYLFQFTRELLPQLLDCIIFLAVHTVLAHFAM
jgi:hypothetical protein